MKSLDCPDLSLISPGHACRDPTLSLIEMPPVRGRPRPLRMKRPGERRSLSRSATRALDVLEFFAEARRPLRAVEVARTLGMTPSTTNQLLKTMVDSAHLVFDARHKTYLPSPRLYDFSAWLVDMYGVGGRLRELLTEVQTRTGMVVTVTTPNDVFMQIIDQASPEGQAPERGLQVDLFGTAIGSAYLSMLDDAEVLRLADRARIARAETPVILATVDRIRGDGYADGVSADGSMWSVAMPLEGLHVAAVLGLAGPAEAVRAKLVDIRAVMREAIARWIDRAGEGG